MISKILKYRFLWLAILTLFTYVTIWCVCWYQETKYNAQKITNIFEKEIKKQISICDSLYLLDSINPQGNYIQNFQNGILDIIKLENGIPTQWNTDKYSAEDISNFKLQQKKLVTSHNTNYYIKKYHHTNEINLLHRNEIDYIFIIPIINFDNYDSKILISNRLNRNLIAHFLSFKSTGEHQINVENDSNIYLVFNGDNYHKANKFIITLFILCILSWITLIHYLSLQIIKYNKILGLFFEILCFTIIYILLIQLELYPKSLINSGLFSSEILSTSESFPNVFSILLSVFLFLFVNNTLLKILNSYTKYHKSLHHILVRLLLSIVTSTGLIYVLLKLNINIYTSVIFDSKISLISDNLQHLNLLSILGLVIIVQSCIITISILQIISQINKLLKFKTLYHTLQNNILLIIVALVLYQTDTNNNIIIATSIFSSIIYLLLYKFPFLPSFRIATSTKNINWQIWVLIICVFCTYTATTYNRSKEIDFRTHYAESIFKAPFNKLEYIFEDKIQLIKKDSILSYLDIANDYENISQYNNYILSKYFDKIENQIIIESSFIPKQSDIVDSCIFINDLDNIYTYKAYIQFDNNLLVLDIITNSVFNYKKNKLEGTILGNNYYSDYQYYANYYTAKYKNGKLVDFDGMIGFPYFIPDNILKVINNDNKILFKATTTSNLLLQNNNNEIVWVKYKVNTPLQLINTFNSIILTILLLLAQAQITSIFYNLNDIRKLYIKNWYIDLNAKLNLTLWITFLISFIVLAVSVVYFISKNEQINNADRNNKNIQLAKHFIEQKLRDGNDNFNIEELLQKFNISAYLYNNKGILLQHITRPQNTQSIINKFLIKQEYLQKLSKEGDFITISSNNNFHNYKNLLVPFNLKNKSYIINIYDYNVNSLVGVNMADILLTFINIFILVIFVASIATFYITKTITKPIKIITQRFKNIDLRNNDLIEWHTNDEFAPLVQEYNKMLEKVESLAEKIATQERNLVWKEFAQQVAHEIKNPLTPMRLNIQYLQRAIDDGRDNIDTLTNKVCNIILEQIDNLNHIATEFSTIAKLDEAKPIVFNLVEKINKIIKLFSIESNVDIKFNSTDDRLEVFMDNSFLNRILTNIIKNAIQAINNAPGGKIEINVIRNGRNVSIAIHDNGPGIPNNMRDKIFLPYFTSKSTGTGIGLSMTKNLIEMSNGKIHFETEVGKGTSFYITLPLHFPNNR